MIPRLPEFIIATEITFDDYLKNYMSERAEWVKGNVVKMSPVKLRHDQLTRYLTRLLEIYLELRPLGSVHNAPFVMRVPMTESAREPDIQVILKTNSGQLTDSFMNGAADLCIEIVSEESIHRDYEVKREEYEAGGVREYWIIDPLKNETRFYRHDGRGYKLYAEDEAGEYRTPTLPDLVLPVPTLWEEILPTPILTMQAVQAMLENT